MSSILKVNQIQDIGGNTIVSSDGSGTFTSNLPAQPQNAFRNIIINGDMSIAQRGTSTASLSSTDSYPACDRWRFAVSGAGTWTVSQSTDVPSGQGFSNSLKLDCTSATASPASGAYLQLLTRFEGQNLQYIKKGTSSAQILTLSFWVKCNKTGNQQIAVRDNDNTRVVCPRFTINSADTWEKKTLEIPADTTGTLGNDNGNSFALEWWLDAGSDFTSGTRPTAWEAKVNTDLAVDNLSLASSTDNEFYITGVQLETGTTASDFEFLPHDVNLERCMRYYQKSYEIDDAPGTATSTGTVGSSGNTSTATTTTQIIETVSLLKPMRAEPTITVYDFAGTSGKVTGIDYGVNEYNNQTGSGFRVGSKHFGVQASSLSNASSSLACHYTASAEL